MVFAAVILALVGAFFLFDVGQYLTLDYLRRQQETLAFQFRTYPLRTALIFFASYVAVTGLSLPGAAVMTLAAGAIFGLLWGTLLVSFASTIGATLAFLAARFLLRETVQRRFGDKLAAVNRGIERDGAFYLFTLRLVPVFPFFVINLMMGLSPIRTPTFYWVSQLGMLAGTVVYVNAGTQLARVESLGDVLSPTLLASFAALGLFPLAAKSLVRVISARKALRRYAKPKRFDRNVVVIGAGAGGLVSAYVAAAVKAKVTLIEKDLMGGDCLNTGCVPSKALLRSAKLLSHVQRAGELGMRAASVEFDFAEVMERVQRVIKQVEPHDSAERYIRMGVDVVHGEARVTSPYTVEVNGRTLTTRNIVLATGARPSVPPIAGIEEVDYLTSDTVWSQRQQPKRLLVLGGGPVGCELAQAFARLGSQVTLVQRAPRILVREDPDITELVQQRFAVEGIDVRVDHHAKEIRREADRQWLVCAHRDKQVEIEFDALLVAVGRTANTTGYGLEELGIPLTSRGTIEVNEYLQTCYPNIYAVGDVAGPMQFTHAAEARNIPYELTTYGIDDLDRAIADSEAHGVVKVLTVPGKDKILGVTIAGEHAADLIAEYVMAMRHGLGLNKILQTVHIYPTLAEANKYAAGEWRRAHAPQALLAWAGRFHRLMRRERVPAAVRSDSSTRRSREDHT
jgi:pyruvate/2-oxoglutarate dehydrogenase complex dihydrolipoamide dehydrogenase (E3) component/uncharacterized membrane protein YdjX (TVP38/TMEM64 family)